MPFLIRSKIDWQGGGIAGLAQTTLHHTITGDTFGQADATDLAAKLKQMLTDSLSPALPATVTVNVDPEFSVIDIPSGQVQNVYAATDNTQGVAGGSSGAYSVASGGVISLNTGQFVRGRRVRGRIFCVPLGGGSYDTGGTLSQPALTALSGFGNSLIQFSGSGRLLSVYSRPSSKGATDGHVSVVTSASVRDKVAILRSRRD